MHHPQVFHKWDIWPELCGEDVAPERSNMTLKKLGILESKQGNAPEESLDITRNPERFGTIEALVYFFLVISDQ